MTPPMQAPRPQPVTPSLGRAPRRYFRVANRPWGWKGGLFAENPMPDGSVTIIMNPEAHTRALAAAAALLRQPRFHGPADERS